MLAPAPVVSIVLYYNYCVKLYLKGKTKCLIFIFALKLCCFISDADGSLCRSGHLLQITLTMHRLIMSSSDLLEKLVTLYPLTALHLKRGANIDITESFLMMAFAKSGHIQYCLCRMFYVQVVSVSVCGKK